ncbi:MAG TPA: PAS domain S-box protein [Mariprofundaceae bacterium]|nr:PAS domain S-box protein [Mariprofundaceae bacterium]
MPLASFDVPTQVLLKRFALIYLPVVIVISLILLLGIHFDRQLHLETTEMGEEGRIDMEKERIMRDLGAVGTDLRVLAGLPVLRRYLDSANPARLDELGNIFLDIARETGRYDQIRYLDASGQEVVRINYNAGKPIIVPKEEMQNKSGRYYFSDTIELNQGEIFVSPLDLNIEHGELEMPYKPMLRYGTPVFDSSGRKKGIILLNYFGEILLQNFRNTSHGGSSHSMLLNRDGYWLSSGKREDEWGFMLGKTDLSFAHDFPDVWRSISSSEHGSVLTDHGLYVFTSVHPLTNAHYYSSTGSAQAYSQSQRDVMAHEYSWKIVSFVPSVVLSAAMSFNQPFSRALIVAMYMLLALASLVVAVAILRRKLAQQKIASLNMELNKQVEELAAGEESLSVTLRSIGDGVMATDAEARVTRLNAVAEKLTGWSQAEAFGRPVYEVFDIINRNTRLPVSLPVPATLTDGAMHGLVNDTVLIARDGSECPVADSCAPIHDRKGDIIGMVLVFRDVSKEYEARQAISDSATRIQTILNHVADGIITINDRGMVETYNRAAVRIFGYTAEEVVGHNVNMLMPEPYRGEHDSYIQRYRDTGEAHIVDTVRKAMGRHKSGITFPIELGIREMRLGDQLYFTGIIRDISIRK